MQLVDATIARDLPIDGGQEEAVGVGAVDGTGALVLAQAPAITSQSHVADWTLMLADETARTLLLAPDASPSLVAGMMPR